MAEPASGFARALQALAEAGVAYLVVGVSGINFYARTPGDAFATLDLDALLAPETGNLKRALSVLSGLGYGFEGGGEPFVDTDDDPTLARVVATGSSLSAVHPESGQIDLMTSIAGFAWDDLARDAARFRVGDVEVRVGSLEKLLRSKAASGRPKDVAFLSAFEARRDEEGA